MNDFLANTPRNKGQIFKPILAKIPVYAYLGGSVLLLVLISIQKDGSMHYGNISAGLFLLAMIWVVFTQFYFFEVCAEGLVIHNQALLHKHYFAWGDIAKVADKKHYFRRGPDIPYLLLQTQRGALSHKFTHRLSTRQTAQLFALIEQHLDKNN